MIFASENELLSFLPAREQQEFYRRLERVPLHCGSVLHEVGDPIEHVYFPVGGAISLVTELTGGTDRNRNGGARRPLEVSAPCIMGGP